MTLRATRHAGVHGWPLSRALPRSLKRKPCCFRGCMSAQGALLPGVSPPAFGVRLAPLVLPREGCNERIHVKGHAHWQALRAVGV